MNKLKTVFHILYFAYLLISVLLFVFKDNIYQQVSDLSFMLRFVEFWVILGFFFLLSMWVVQVVNLRFLRKDKEELVSEIEGLKQKIYQIDRSDTRSTESTPTNDPSSLKDSNP